MGVGGHELKNLAVFVGGGGQSMRSSSVERGSQNQMSDFSRKRGNRLHFCKMSLASRGLSPPDP